MNTNPKRPLRVFLCHASNDKEKIRVLYKDLVLRGVDAWLDEESLLPGQHWRNEIPKAVYASDAIIVCLSKNATTKEGYIQKEIKYALDAASEKPDGTIFLIPVKLEECDVPTPLNDLQWTNLFYKFGSFDAKDFKRLMRSLNARAVSVEANLPKDVSLQNKLDAIYEIHHPKPLLVVISGPSGAGKDTVIEKMKEMQLDYHFVITATTRAPHKDEIHGKDYFFVTKEEFAHMIDEDELIEHAIVYGDYKGIPKEQVRDALLHGKDVIMRIDVQGAETIRRMAHEAVLIFLTTNTEDELINRLKKRKTETPDWLSLRIATARRELQRVEAFDYIVINHENRLDETISIIRAIIEVEHHRVHHRKIDL